MIAIIFSVFGLIFYGVFNFFFDTKDTPRIGKII